MIKQTFLSSFVVYLNIYYKAMVGDFIKKMRELKGLSQKQVALASKMDPAHYSRIENGKTDPSFSVVERIANVLEVDLNELFSANELKEINSYDKTILEKINLLEQLEPTEKSAFFTMLDALITKKKLKDNLTNALQGV